MPMKKRQRPYYYSMGPDYNVYAYSPAEWGVRRGFLQGLWPGTIPGLAIQISFLAVPLLFSAILVLQGVWSALKPHQFNAGIAGLCIYGTTIAISVFHIAQIREARKLRRDRGLPEPGLELPDTVARRWFLRWPGIIADSRSNFPGSADPYPGETVDLPAGLSHRAERSLFFATGRDRSVIHAYTPGEWGAVGGMPRDWRAATTAAAILLLAPGLLSPALIAIGIGMLNTSVIVFGAVLTAVFSPALAGVYNAAVRAHGAAALRRRKGLPTPKFLVSDADARQWFQYYPGRVPLTRANFPGSNAPFPGESAAEAPPFDIERPPDVDALFPADGGSGGQQLRQKRNMAMKAWHDAAVAAGREQRLVRTETGQLHSYALDELGLKPATTGNQLTSWWGMAILGTFSASFAGVLAYLGLSGSAPEAGSWVATALSVLFFGLSWLCFHYAAADYRARQRRRERGVPEPASRT